MSGQGMLDRLAQWMRGRNGQDDLGQTALGLSITLSVINLFVDKQVISLLALAAALYACWRLCSRNVEARQKENRAFVTTMGPVAHFFSHPRATISELRQYKRLHCPACNQQMRVPRGKGKLRVTCPTCHHSFETKS